ncbi:FecR domain-containing protein [Mucilaginibacter sp. Bleaf8]|uniref:FecR domain-containing protein n=1 Tax=Mucilaginibacter sp. Bleaf8 TaxID=2834430 RepID=UPI001BCE3C77|nr:FecR domain-containing protein [Mucilaginibacter sp. Bleaf8]MBS7566681.1 FecR domain-containing protein [Mucilaginibacter sp. Bleaf8]
MKIHDDILISYLLDEATAEQRKEIETWLKADAENQRRLEQFKLIWQASKSSSLNQQMDAQASLQRFKQKALEPQQDTADVAHLKPLYTWLKIAATLLLLAGGSWWFWMQRPAAQIELATTRFEVKADTLSDGSVVTLNQETTLRYPEQFKGKRREVVLSKGEAFFDVAHIANEPFIMHAGKIQVQVLGTSFNVKNNNGKIEIIVESGMVAVSRGTQTVMLKPREKLSIESSGGALVKSNTNNQLYKYYRTHEFVADDTPLWQLVNVLNEAYASHIVITNPKLNNMPLNTTFKNESLDDILDIISRTFEIKVVKANGVTILK